MMKFRKHFDYDVEKASDEATIAADQQGESLTVQSQAEDADINVLMRRYGITGKLPDNPSPPEYGDFTEITDFQSALAAVMDAQSRFMEFPADVRARFDNDPQRMLEFVSSRANVDEAIKLGILSQESVKARQAELAAAEHAKYAEVLEAAKRAGMRFEEAPKEGAKAPAPGST